MGSKAFKNIFLRNRRVFQQGAENINQGLTRTGEEGVAGA